MVIVYLGADHRGFRLKEVIKEFLKSRSYSDVIDLGNFKYEDNDDYPDFASAVAREVGKDPETRRGILICGSGVGVDVVANKFSHIRSALAISPEQVKSARNDDDVNVLSLASDFTSEEDAKNIVDVFLSTPFSGAERYVRRIQKIVQVETSRYLC